MAYFPLLVLIPHPVDDDEMDDELEEDMDDYDEEQGSFGDMEGKMQSI